MSKKELAEKLGFDFEEIKDILSEETLKSFEQNSVVGGEEPTQDSSCPVIVTPPLLDSTCGVPIELPAQDSSCVQYLSC
jgi:hypothetical protein